LPSTVSISTLGGKNGVIPYYGDSAHGARPGTAGVTVYNYKIPTNVLAPTPLTLVTKPDTLICEKSGSVVTYKMFASGGDSYTWSPAALVDSPTSSSPTATVSSSTTFMVIVKNTSGCIDTGFISIKVKTGNVDIKEDTIYACINDSITITATGVTSYRWGMPFSSTYSPSNTLNVQANESKMYFVEGIDEVGCISIDSVFVDTSSPPQVIILQDQFSGCKGDIIELEATGVNHYVWLPDYNFTNPTESKTRMVLVESGTFIVKGYNNINCVSYDTFNVNVNPLPNVKIQTSGKYLNCLKNDITLTATGAQNYTWSPAHIFNNPTSSSSTIQLNGSAYVYVKGIDGNGCESADSVRIEYEGDAIVKFPNAFTPNNDSYNDEFKPIVHCAKELKEFLIYDRWGNQMFNTQVLDEGWDGTFGGKPCVVGVYYYLYIIKSWSGVEVMYKGDVTLIR
jgi:gliding motility-associated-like protein